MTAYSLWLGTTGVGSSNLYNSTPPLTTLSTTVTGLPITGGTIYARMWSEINGVWQSTDYTYTASGSAVKAVLTSPAPGSTLTGSTVTFGWTAGTAVTTYSLWLGTTGVGSSNLYNSTPPLTTLSTTVTGLPTTGGTIYARMWSEINGVWQSTDYTYTASGSAVKAVLTSPAPGSTLTGSTVTFGWTAGTAVTTYSLWLGTTGVRLEQSVQLDSAVDHAFDHGHGTADHRRNDLCPDVVGDQRGLAVDRLHIHGILTDSDDVRTF